MMKASATVSIRGKNGVAWIIPENHEDLRFAMCHEHDNRVEEFNRAGKKSYVEKRLIERRLKKRNFPAKHSLDRRIRAARERKQKVLLQKKRAAAAVIQMAYLKSHRVASSAKIQKWWKLERIVRKRVRRVISSNLCSKLSTLLRFPEIVNDLEEKQNDEQIFRNFDMFSVHLCDRNVIAAFRAVIGTVCLPPGKEMTLSPAAIRQSLSAIIINRFPEVVLGTPSPADETLVELRKNVISSANAFEKSILNLQTSISEAVAAQESSRCLLTSCQFRRVSSSVISTRTLWKLFRKDFLKWKITDAKKVSTELLQAFQRIRKDFEETEAAVKEQENAGIEVDPGLMQFYHGLQNQLSNLKKKARQLLSKTDYEEWEERALTEDFVEDSKNDAIPVFDLWKEKQIYELLIDPDYSIERPKTSIDSNSEELLKGQLQQNLYNVFIQILANIVDRLCSLTPNREDLKAQVQEHIDVELVQQQLSKSSFEKADFIGIVTFIADRILLLQAPVRAQGTNEWIQQLTQMAVTESDWESLAPAALNFVLQEISQIELDLANFQLKLLSRVTRQDVDSSEDESDEIEGIRFIRRKVAEIGEDKVISSLKSVLAPLSVTSVSELAQMFSSCAVNSETPLPASLAMFDQEKFLTFQRTAVEICKLVSYEIIFCNQDKTPSRELRDKLRETLSSVDTSTIDDRFGNFVEEHVRDSSLREKMLQSCKSKVMYKNILSKLEAILEKSAKEAIQLELYDQWALAADTISKSVFFAWQKEVSTLCEKFTRVAQINTHVFRNIYEKALE